jgi:aspartokinase
MVTVTEIISKIIRETPFLEEGLSEGIINLSALARKFKPQIENELLKPISESAVLMALKRMTPEIQKKNISLSSHNTELRDLTVRSGLSEFTFQKSDTIHEKRLILLKELQSRPDYFVTFTQGMYEITMILTSNLESRVLDIFKEEKLITHLSDLAAVTVRLTDEMVYTPGIQYNILKQLAWHNINVVEVVSTFTEFNIILHKSQVDKSFSTLLKYFHS